MAVHRGGSPTAPHLLQHPRIIQCSADVLIPADPDMIGLAEFNGRAEMLTRVDRKYIVTRSHIPDIISGLDMDTKVLSIAGVRSQAYAPTHFDTPGLRSFLDTAWPRRRRYKTRTRAYPDSSIAFLKVKIRGACNTTVRTRILCGVEDAYAGRIIIEGEVWIRKTLTIVTCETPTPGLFRPVLRGSYTRAALLMPHGDGRATIDFDLKWTSLRYVGTGDGEGVSLGAFDSVIIETKSDSMPFALDHPLRERGHCPARISKYATAIVVLDPLLLRNR